MIEKIATNFFLFTTFFLTTLVAQQKKGFEISGHLDGIKNGEKALLGHFTDPSKNAIKDDSCIVKDGNFSLKTVAGDNDPHFYFVSFDNDGVHHRVHNEEINRNIGGDAINLFIANGDKISIRGGDINKMNQEYFESEILIDGSRYNAAYLSLRPVFYTSQIELTTINFLINKIKDSVGFDNALVQGYIESKEAIDFALRRILFENNLPEYKSASIALLPYLGNYHGRYLTDLLASLDEQTKKNYLGEILKSDAVLAIGQPLPGFTLPTAEGKLVSLKDEVGKSKLTIVHLWGSNSVDRATYQQELRMLYKKYHNKGLDIIGFSADSVAEEWKLRLMVEKYPWVNVSDLKGNLAGGFVQDVYHEGGHNIPNTTNILLDEKGRIIAWDVSGAELQWYLWKYLGD